MRSILYLKLVIRQLRTSPGFTATAVLMLAFGIGATTAIFSIVDDFLPVPTALSRSQPPGHSWRLGERVRLDDRTRLGNRARSGGLLAQYPLLSEPRRLRLRALRAFARWPAHPNPSRTHDALRFLHVGCCSAMGRVFTPEEDQQKAHVAVLSYAAWKSRFNGNPT